MNQGLTPEQKRSLVGSPLNISPYWPGLLPYCSYSECSMYDGKRCQLIGSTPVDTPRPKGAGILGSQTGLN